jgi:hypothetical protein
MMDQDNTTWTGARAPGVERVSRSHGGVVGHVPYLDSERGHMALQTTRRSEANHGGLLIDPSYLGQAPTDSRPWSRTGENPPYGILGGTMETSASFEARLAPSSYPTPLGKGNQNKNLLASYPPHPLSGTERGDSGRE